MALQKKKKKRKKKEKSCLIQQMKQNLSRGEMALIALLHFSSGEEWLCKVVTKVKVQGLFFYFFFIFFVGVSPLILYFNQKLIYIFTGIDSETMQTV